MFQLEQNNLNYLSKAFSGLSIEKKDTILNTARSLLTIQEKGAGSPQKERKETKKAE